MIEYIPAKTIVSGYKMNNSWFGTEYNMNIYRGCDHGCIYCDSRSECYRNDKFDQIRAKENALEIIRNDLRRKIKTGVVGSGAMSDPYNRYEKALNLTRHSLELIEAYGFGAAICTKSELILRDMDLFQLIKERSPVILKITITAFDDNLCKAIEPNVSPSSSRFEALQKLTDSGLFAGILLMPTLPFITDNEENIISIVKAAHECGARFIYAAMGMTMRDRQRDFYYNALDKKFPGIRGKYEKLYGNRYNCSSPRAKELWNVFVRECDKYGILYKMNEIIRGYRLGYETEQLRFF